VSGPADPEPAAPWTVRIGEANRDALAALVAENLESFSEREILLVLNHPYVTTAVVGQIVRSRIFLRARSVRRALALHPATPRPDALRFLEDLLWRDLAAVAREVRAPAPVRQAANRRLLEVLRRLSRGEKAALARLTDRDLFQPLLEENEPMILEALLQNARLTADDLVRWLTVGRATAAALEKLAGTVRWSHRPAVREALIRHRLTPRAAALALLLSATRSEWLRMAKDETVHPLLSACARRLCEASISFIDSGRTRVLT
jgi:hypothetical protein